MRAVFAVALTLILPTAETRTLERNLARTVKAAQEVEIGYALRWNRFCEPVTPKMVLTRPPDHGSICARDFVTIAKANVVSDDQTCIGKSIKGLQIIYLARSDYVGHDTVEYVTEFPGVTRNTHANIDVRPPDRPLSAHPGEESIAPGKAGDIIAACAPLSS